MRLVVMQGKAACVQERWDSALKIPIFPPQHWPELGSTAGCFKGV